MLGTNDERADDHSPDADANDNDEDKDPSKEAMASGHQLAPEDGTVLTSSGERVPEPEDAASSDDSAVATHLETIEELAESPHRGDESTQPPGTVQPDPSSDDRPAPS